MSVLNFVVSYSNPPTGNNYYFRRFNRTDSGLKPIGVQRNGFHRDKAARFNFLGAWRTKQLLDTAGYKAIVCWSPED